MRRGRLPVACAEKALFSSFESAFVGSLVIDQLRLALEAQRVATQDPEPLRIEFRSLKSQIANLIDSLGSGKGTSTITLRSRSGLWRVDLPWRSLAAPLGVFWFILTVLGMVLLVRAGCGLCDRSPKTAKALGLTTPPSLLQRALRRCGAGHDRLNASPAVLSWTSRQHVPHPDELTRKMSRSPHGLARPTASASH